ncbi:MAG: hypothetical protein ACO26U_14170, partial [Burkholderiaceae bacterium]
MSEHRLAAITQSWQMLTSLLEAGRLIPEVLSAPDGDTGFRMVEEIVQAEGRTFIHPFEGPRVTAATATC